MSAANVILQPAAGFLFSDAAAWAPDGKLVAVGSKLIALPRVPAALSFRGWLPEMETVRPYLDRWWICGVEAVMECCRRIGEVMDRTPRPEGYAPGGGTEFTLVAWLKKEGRPAAWRMSTENPAAAGYDGAAKGAGAYEFAETSILDCAPGLDRDDLGALGKLESVDDVFAIEAESAGVTLMEAQRRRPNRVRGVAEPIYTVGGFVEMASVTAAGVTVKRLRTWPDEVGRAIEP